MFRWLPEHFRSRPIRFMHYTATLYPTIGKYNGDLNQKYAVPQDWIETTEKFQWLYRHIFDLTGFSTVILARLNHGVGQSFFHNEVELLN